MTGAPSRIGEEFARQAAASGINIVLLARREERLKEVTAELEGRYHVQARTIAVDLGRDGILHPVAEATDLDIDLVVSNAGAGHLGPFISLPRARLRQIVLAPLIVNTGVVARMGIDAAPLPAAAISVEQALDEALTALAENKAATVTRAELAAGYEGIKKAVVGRSKSGSRRLRLRTDALAQVR